MVTPPPWTATRRTAPNCERRPLFSTTTATESPAAGSTSTSPFTFLSQTDCFGAILPLHVHTAAVSPGASGPASSAEFSPSKLKLKPRRTRPTTLPMVRPAMRTTAKRPAPRMMSRRHVIQNRLRSLAHPAVARAELRCQTGRAAWQRHDGPAARRRGDDLDGVARHGKGLTVHFHDRFEAGHLGDAVPRTAAHFAIHVLLQTGPAHSGHERTSGASSVERWARGKAGEHHIKAHQRR